MQGSLDALNKLLKEPIPINRFRPKYKSESYNICLLSKSILCLYVYSICFSLYIVGVMFYSSGGTPPPPKLYIGLTMLIIFYGIVFSPLFNYPHYFSHFVWCMNPFFILEFGSILVDGCEPFSEDLWMGIRINNCTFQGVKLCDRCKVKVIFLHFCIFCENVSFN